MTNAPVRITAAFVAILVLAVAVFAAFYIVGALAAVVVCAALGIGLIALVAAASRKLAHYGDRKTVNASMTPVRAPTNEPRV